MYIYITFEREFFIQEILIVIMGVLNNFLSTITFTNILTGLLSLVCIYVIHFYYKHFTRPNPLPGPIPFPLIGSLAIFIEDIDDWFWRVNKNYGHNGIFELNIAGNRQIVVTRAEYANILLDNKTFITRTPNNGLLDLFDLEKKGMGMNHS